MRDAAGVTLYSERSNFLFQSINHITFLLAEAKQFLKTSKMLQLQTNFSCTLNRQQNLPLRLFH
jgi:hypothetical protein